MPELWLEEAAKRMTRLLARPPRNHKTRAYLAAMPKRKAIVVKPEDYPHVVTRAEARLNAALQKLRDERRYADWERRGKPPSPTVPRKDRRRPRAAHRDDPLRTRLYEAQDGLCGLCGARIYEVAEGTLDHVTPRVLGGQNVGNLLLAHGRCNNEKGGREPTRTELEMLVLVNARLASMARSSMAEPSAHNGFDVGSIPAGPTSDSDTRPKAGDKGTLGSTRE